MNDEFNTVNDNNEQPVPTEPVTPPVESAEPVPTEPVAPPVEAAEPAPTEPAPPVEAAQNPNYNPNFNPNFNPSNSAAFVQPTKPTKIKDSKTGLRIISICIAAALLLAVGVGGGYLLGSGGIKSGSLADNDIKNDLSPGGNVEIIQGETPKKDGIEPDENGKYTADKVSKIVSPSVVNITVYSETSQGTAIASGVVLDKTGYILSNDHIYSEIPGAKFIITMSDGNAYKAVYVAGDSRSDLCVLKLTDIPKALTPAVFGNSADVEAGDEAVAIGSPFGLSGTVTKGIISSPSRRISFSVNDKNGGTSKYSMRVIQTDTPLNSGNSGGALVNMYGQVIGISSSKIVLSGYEGLCFAIPANDAIRYAQSLIKNKKVVGRAKLGITYNGISRAASLIRGTPSGLMIAEINVDSELHSKGVGVNDIVTQIDGQEITSPDIALDIIDSKNAGDSVELKIYLAEKKKYRTYNVKLLEDESVSGYSTQAPAPTTASPYYPFS